MINCSSSLNFIWSDVVGKDVAAFDVATVESFELVAPADENDVVSPSDGAVEVVVVFNPKDNPGAGLLPAASPAGLLSLSPKPTAVFGASDTLVGLSPPRPSAGFEAEGTPKDKTGALDVDTAGVDV